MSAPSAPPPAVARRGSRLGRWLVALAAAGIVAVVAVGGVVAWRVRSWMDRPLQPGAQPVIFEVRRGQSAGQIARDLERAGLASHPRLLALVARHQKLDTRVRSGEYELSASLSPREILRRLAEGNVIQLRFTLPEGLTRREIARVIAATGLVTEAAFLSATSDATLAAELGVEGADFEGYLFPDTYQFERGTPPERIVRTLVARFRRVADEVLAPSLASRGLTLRQAVTLASIVEKETGRADERPVIAAVFFNRLARGMRLESDPTVIYGIPDFDGNLTRVHLRAATPYNTYVITGLPAGPIANPGAESLAAVARPADAPYLFFVAKGDGSHQFSATLAEHTRAVQRYQLGRGGGP